MVNEFAFIQAMQNNRLKSPNQINACWQADCELIRLPGFDKILAVTTDGLSEELETFLYDDPFHIGWMLVTINASDLAAVAASPLGMLVNMTLPQNNSLLTPSYIEQLQCGIQHACLHYKLPLFGGDTNFANHYQLSATAMGLCNKPLTRMGSRPGDLLCASGYLGAGNLYAFKRLMTKEQVAYETFMPEAPLQFAQIIAPYARSCMDISDGLMESLECLAGLNGVGFRLDNAHDYLTQESIASARQYGIPAELFLCGHHGDFELLFTIPPESREDLLTLSAKADYNPLIIGQVTEQQIIQIGEHHFKMNTFRQAWENYGNDINSYFKTLMSLFT